jgi:hypothetical protein
MKSSISAFLASAGFGLAAAASAHGAEILVTSDINTSTTWTKNNVYVLKADVYVNPGATLTIEAGTVVASELTTNTRAALIATKGARIVAIGTQDEPIIFTSQADYDTWSATNPRGVYRPTATSEWGNLTLLGAGYISEDAVVGNTAAPNANNVAVMEGLIASGPTDTRPFYGGGNDDDNSGTLSYVSIRYGGQFVGNNVELNGLACGGVGRETIIDHIDVINNLDDGIEIWGGTVNMQYVSIWNVGDDSLDLDQGWRGKVQYGFIVQGYCKAGSTSGSGFGDNGIEMDGAERSDYQPVTSGVLYNMTVVGNPGTGSGSNGGDLATAWRDNVNMQIRQSVFTGFGEAFVRSENPSDGSGGFGLNGTLNFQSRWSTPYSYLLTAGGSNINAPANPVAMYRAQVNGNLCEVKDTVVHNFPNTSLSNSGSTIAGLPTGPFAEADFLGFSSKANGNVKATSLPVAALTRGTTVVVSPSLSVSPVAAIDPRAANDAANASLVAPAPNDGFFEASNFRGAFASDSVWTCGWTAADDYGLISTPREFCTVSVACPADLNGDGEVSAADLSALLGNWGGTGTGDVDGSGQVDAADLSALLGAWGNCG